MLSIYILEVADFNQRIKPINEVIRYLYACFLATLIISSVFYVSALAWTTGGQDLLGRGVVLPAIIGTAILGSFTRYATFSRINKTRVKSNWLIIGSTSDSTVSQFLDIWNKNMPEDSVYLLSLGSEASEIQNKNMLYNEKYNSVNNDKLLSMQWTGIVLLDDLTLSDEHLEKLMHARLNGNPIFNISEFYEEVWKKIPVMHINNRWFVINGGFWLLHEEIHRRIKRLSDIGLSIILMITTFPLMIAAAIWVLLVGGHGSIIFKQIRTGLKDKEFTIYKFRTMRQNSESNGAQWASKNDKRVILLGSIIRKFRIDELPQLWNIIKGDMSFIGPRPERPELISKIEEKTPFFSLRHLVRPGLTGWAQVCYPYGASIDDAREKLEYDLYYIKNQSVALDFIIILRTIRVILHGYGGR